MTIEDGLARSHPLGVGDLGASVDRPERPHDLPISVAALESKAAAEPVRGSVGRLDTLSRVHPDGYAVPEHSIGAGRSAAGSADAALQLDLGLGGAKGLDTTRRREINRNAGLSADSHARVYATHRSRPEVDRGVDPHLSLRQYSSVGVFPRGR